MIPKNNFKSLHRKYYCLKFTIFKLQVKRILCCFKTHSEDRLEEGHCSSCRDNDPVSENCPSPLEYATSSVSTLSAVTRDTDLRSQRVEFEAELSGVQRKH